MNKSPKLYRFFASRASDISLFYTLFFLYYSYNAPELVRNISFRIKNDFLILETRHIYKKFPLSEEGIFNASFEVTLSDFQNHLEQLIQTYK